MELTRATARAKRSCADRGYIEDSYVGHFVEVGEVRVDPSINRGYFARIRSIDGVVRSFVDRCTAETKAQIVCLGAGFDTAFWRLGEDAAVEYYEVDVKAVVAAKAAVIAKTPALRQALGSEATVDESGVSSPRYSLAACDLREIGLVADRLATAGLKMDRPTVVVCECVLAYLEPEASSALLQWAATFEDVLVVDYDMMVPNDGFGKVMAANFERRNWPLRSASKFRTLDDHRRRLAPSFETNEVADMHAVCEKVVLAEPAERARLFKLEIFDDPDEFKLMMTHYCLALAANGARGAAVIDAVRLKLRVETPPIPVVPPRPTSPATLPPQPPATSF